MSYTTYAFVSLQCESVPDSGGGITTQRNTKWRENAASIKWEDNLKFTIKFQVNIFVVEIAMENRSHQPAPQKKCKMQDWKRVPDLFSITKRELFQHPNDVFVRTACVSWAPRVFFQPAVCSQHPKKKHVASERCFWRNNVFSTQEKVFLAPKRKCFSKHRHDIFEHRGLFLTPAQCFSEPSQWCFRST